MNLTELQFLLKKYKISPDKIKGQNFLVSDEVLTDIVEHSKLNKKDLVLEVGPGPGALSQVLSQQAGQVVAFEIDKNFSKLLNNLVSINKNIEVVWQDILSLSANDWKKFLTKYHKNNYKIIANIPYYITGKFIQKFVAFADKPTSMTLMVQKEVAQRATDSQKHSLLSLSIAFYAKAKILFEVKRDNFFPQPKVDSAILYIYDIVDWPYQVEEKKVWQIVKRGFAFKRKKLFNNLLSDRNVDKQSLQNIFNKCNLDLNIRAERLKVEDWINLAKNL